MTIRNTGFVPPRPPPPTVPVTLNNPRLVPQPADNGVTVWVVGLTVGRIIDRLIAMQQQTAVLESPIYGTEGEQFTWTLTYEGATTVATPSVVAYKQNDLVTSTIFPTNTPTASGAVVTLSLATGFTAGRYVIVVTATVDGAVKIRKIVVFVAAAGAEA